MIAKRRLRPSLSGWQIGATSCAAPGTERSHQLIESKGMYKIWSCQMRICWWYLAARSAAGSEGLDLSRAGNTYPPLPPGLGAVQHALH